MGTMGVCPAGASARAGDAARHASAATSTRASSCKGTTLYLPVSVEGALFSTGDAHGCQGDGEICVTGLEAPMYATHALPRWRRAARSPRRSTGPRPAR